MWEVFWEGRRFKTAVKNSNWRLLKANNVTNILTKEAISTITKEFSLERSVSNANNATNVLNKETFKNS